MTDPKPPAEGMRRWHQRRLAAGYQRPEPVEPAPADDLDELGRTPEEAFEQEDKPRYGPHRRRDTLDAVHAARTMEDTARAVHDLLRYVEATGDESVIDDVVREHRGLA